MSLRTLILGLTGGLVFAATPAAYAQSADSEPLLDDHSSGAEGSAADETSPARATPRSQPGAVPSHLPCIPSDPPERCKPSRDGGRPSRASRVTLASAVGLGAELGLGITGSLIGYALCTDQNEWFGCAGHAGVGLLTGGVLGAVGGVYLTGEGMGGDGQLWATTVGGLSGTAVGFVGAAALYESLDEAALLLLLAGPVTGAVVGYELSASSRRVTAPRDRAQSVRVLAAPSRDGGLKLAVSGQF